jgi:hypothetical protein
MAFDNDRRMRSSAPRPDPRKQQLLGPPDRSGGGGGQLDDGRGLLGPPIQAPGFSDRDPIGILGPPINSGPGGRPIGPPQIAPPLPIGPLPFDGPISPFDGPIGPGPRPIGPGGGGIIDPGGGAGGFLPPQPSNPLLEMLGIAPAPSPFPQQDFADQLIMQLFGGGR